MTPNADPPSRAPLQFSLRALFGITTAVAVLFGLLRWAGVPPKVSVLVLVILSIGSAAAVGLLVVIAGAAQDAAGSERKTVREPRSGDDDSAAGDTKDS